MDWKGNKNRNGDNSWRASVAIQVLKNDLDQSDGGRDDGVNRQIEDIFEGDLNSTWK